MPRVTILPVSANNLQTSLSVHSSMDTTVLANYWIGISLVLDQSTNYEDIWHTKAYSKCYCGRQGVSALARRTFLGYFFFWKELTIDYLNQVDFEQIANLSINLLIFSIVNKVNMVLSPLKG